MGNLLRLVLITFVAGSGVAATMAADSPVPDVPAPKPPFIARAPEQSSWLIDITPARTAPGSPSAKFLRAQLWTKSGTALQCANEWSDGTRTEDTVVGSTKFAQSPNGIGVHQYSPKLDPRYHDFSTGDFEMLDWITPQDYMGAVNHGGQTCYLFHTKGAAATATGGASGSHDLTLAEINTPASPTSAYISARTGLPVEIDNSDDKFVFKFGAPGELKMPDIRPPAPPTPPAPTPAPTPAPITKKVKKTPPPAPKAVNKSNPANQTNAPDATSAL